MEDSSLGTIAWLDLTTVHTEQTLAFYQQVVGWYAQAVEMGSYQDFAISPTEHGEPVAGICHARGSNIDLPPVWLPYFLVADVEKAVTNVTALGGSLYTPIKTMGKDRFVVIKDPAGAACALYQKGKE
ncbi:VOC family protein [Thalassotalea euphylliae]|uniref:VOC family protein n=1 Tax=Thalassotalea euphylliae TaxID=1655234 RepID=A0A3E0TRP7_9GAMM|nr:VOC family protein [Thalassotalea euphylliae]REL27296.1 VOC family protein [Thalassotalea euphylliae]